MNWRDFDMNDFVRVKLTDRGREILRQQNAELRREFPYLPAYTPRKEDADGWSEWQLFSLMQHFGAYIEIGGNPSTYPFEVGIQLSA